MRNLGLSTVLIGLFAVSASNNWPAGVQAQPTGYTAPWYDIVYGPHDVDHPQSDTLLGGSVSNRPTYYEDLGGGNWSQHGWSRTSVRPNLTFAGKFWDLTFAHGVTGTTYNTTGVFYATDYDPASGGSPGGN